MNALDVVHTAARSTGYRHEAIIRDYTFADVLDPTDTTRKAALAAFTQTPPSYRTAALGVVPSVAGETKDLVRGYRALGAPLMFVIEGDKLSLWQVRDDVPQCMRKNISVNDIPGLFEKNRTAWSPDAIHRAKSIAAIDQSYQLDFVDLGLLPAVEGEIHTKIDHLLLDMLAAATDAQRGEPPSPRELFPVLFRLLAAKVLQDRQHPAADNWNPDSLQSILQTIESHYSLPNMRSGQGRVLVPAFSAAWNCLRRGINFSNISADDLAFVYENTLVTKETRKHFGTHSTPRQLAEYAVSRLELHHHDPRDLQIYEPFTGAGAFLVSAFRHIRNLLPISWRDKQRHDFLINHLAGDELDSFAREVAILSLILADYPNQNGWRIGEVDLFENGELENRIRGNNVVLCNPPFENFDSNERALYSISDRFLSKPMAVLDAAIRAEPLALAFVLPHSFIFGKKFNDQRKALERSFNEIELVELPKDIFRASVIESSLLIARREANECRPYRNLRSTEVSGKDRLGFLKTGKTTVQRRERRNIGSRITGNLWIPSLKTIWDYADSSPCLGELFSIHRGLEWISKQEEAWSPKHQPGYQLGIQTARKARQFALHTPVWLDCRPDRLRRGAVNRPWQLPKIIVNAGRLSIGPWRLAAATDVKGLICSQQYFGLWPHEALSEARLVAFSAVLNGPVANAFVADHSPAKGITVSVMKRIPLPLTIPRSVEELAVEYIRHLDMNSIVGAPSVGVEKLLMELDAEVLGAYDFPPRLEHELLCYFENASRPVCHRWSHWNFKEFTPGLTLAERVSGRFHQPTLDIGEIFPPLPHSEAELFGEYGV